MSTIEEIGKMQAEPLIRLIQREEGIRLTSLQRNIVECLYINYRDNVFELVSSRGAGGSTICKILLRYCPYVHIFVRNMERTREYLPNYFLNRVHSIQEEFRRSRDINTAIFDNCEPESRYQNTQYE